MEALSLPLRPRSRRCVRGRAVLAVVVAALAAGSGMALAQPTEHEIKAAMIFNITRFVEWPAASFASPSTPIILVILGQDGVGDALELMLRRKAVNGHPFKVRRVSTVSEIRKCHVVYLAESEERRIDSILDALGDASTLTVADIDGFAARGGHINLVLEDQRVRVWVNPASADASQLKISAKLMSLARLVEPTP